MASPYRTAAVPPAREEPGDRVLLLAGAVLWLASAARVGSAIASGEFDVEGNVAFVVFLLLAWFLAGEARIRFRSASPRPRRTRADRPG